jgi:transposase
MEKIQDLLAKKIDGRKLTHEQSEYIRIQAVKAVRQKKQSPEDVISTFGLHRSNIYKWLEKYDKNGYSSLRSTKSKGPAPKLSSQQKEKLAKCLLKNPTQLRFEYALWTVPMIVELIAIKFDVLYSSVQVGRLLKQLGFSKQKPLERAYQQDPEKVAEWLEKNYPAIKKEAKKEKRVIYFSDEAGFHATAQYGSTWAPIGQTPIIKSTGQRQKVNCISAISNRGKLRFMLYEEKFTAKVFIQFLKRLLHNQKQPISIIVDGHRTHFTKAVKEFIKNTKSKLKIYQLPSYSPELNPDELVWNNAKQKVAKRKHSKTHKTFKVVVNENMIKIQRNETLLKSFFCEKNVAYAM